MSRHYKRIKNGKGTVLEIREEDSIDDSCYISVGANGTDVMIRGAGIFLAFDTWEDFIEAIDETKASYKSQ